MFSRIIAPIWQGNTRSEGIIKGALELQQTLGGVWLEVEKSANLQKTDHIKAKPELLKAQRALQKELHNHQKIALLGGDCSSDFALLATNSQRHCSDFAVVWFDTHADLNTPDSSPSGHFHGMVLRANLGDTDVDFLTLNPNPIVPSQIFLIGVRDFDPPELEYVQQNNIKVLSIAALRQNPKQLAEQILLSGYLKLHIHLDLDVLNNFSSTDFASSGGFEPEELLAVIAALKGRLELVSFAVTEYSPKNPDDVQIVLRLIAALEDI